MSVDDLPLFSPPHAAPSRRQESTPLSAAGGIVLPAKPDMAGPLGAARLRLSAPSARPLDLAWARSIVTQCKAADVPCFVKQLGAHPGGYRHCDIPACNCGSSHWHSMALDDQKGGDPSEWPADLRVRQLEVQP